MASKWHTFVSDGSRWFFPERSGVYVLFYNGRLAYIGMAMNLRARMTGHEVLPSPADIQRLGPIKAPDGITYRCEVKYRIDRYYGECATLELRLIRRLKPVLNRRNTARASA